MKAAAREADVLPGACHTRGAAVPWVFAQVLMANATPGGTLLDVGCGDGRELLALAPHFECIIAIDPDKTKLAMTRQNLRRRRIRNIKVCAGRWQRLPVHDASVDVVSSRFSGVHAAEAHRVLKPGGLLVAECVGPPETDAKPASQADPQSATMEFAATLYAALRRHFEHVGMRHALWPGQARAADLLADAAVSWDAAPDILATPVAVAAAVPRMRFIAVCRKAL